MCHPTRSDQNATRRVTFGATVKVFYFSIDISDNPGSTSGPPIQLSWEVIDTHDIDIVAWESRDRHGGKVLKIHSNMRLQILKDHGVSRRDIQFYQKCANIIRARRKISVQRVQWDRVDEAIEKAFRTLFCRFAEVELGYPQHHRCQSSSMKAEEITEAAEITEEEGSTPCEKVFSRQPSCPRFGVVALEMDEPNCENALMYNADFTKIFHRTSLTSANSSSRHLEDSSHASFTRTSLFRASLQQYSSTRHLQVSDEGEEVSELHKDMNESSGCTTASDATFQNENDVIVLECQ